MDIEGSWFCWFAALFCFLLVGSLVSYVILLAFIRVRLGKPPYDRLSIAYKYAYLGKSVHNELFNRLQCMFPGCRAIKLCYSGPQASYIEYAYGIILNEGTTTNSTLMKQQLCQNMFQLFTTPEISYALYLLMPVVSWVRICHWLAVAIGYIKIFNFSQKHNLCGYPVLEVYEKDRICLIVPLAKQDDYVVWQAERIVYGYSYSAMLRPPKPIYEPDFEKIPSAPVTLNTPKSSQKLKGKKKKG